MLLNLDQRTDEWKKWKKNRIGSSEIATIMGLNPYMTPLQLYNDKLGDVDRPMTYAMQKGIINEPVALHAFHKNFTSHVFSPACFQDDTYEWMIASVDGYSPECNEIVEIKCPFTFNKFSESVREIPEMYYVQIQWQLMITGATCAHYFCWYDGQSFEKIIYPNKGFWETMHQKAFEFMECLGTMTPPEITAKDRLAVQDDDLDFTAYLYKEKHQQIEKLKEELEKLRSVLVEQTKHHDKVEINNLLISKYTVKGSIDYESIPALKGLDLEPFRKPSRTQTKITII